MGAGEDLYDLYIPREGDAEQDHTSQFVEFKSKWMLGELTETV